MKKNIGLIDKAVRTFVAVSIGILYLTGQITGTAAIILGTVAVIFLLTGLVSFCPLYVPFKISTKK